MGKVDPPDDDDAAFNSAFDEREMRRLTSEIGPIFRQHGMGTVEESEVVRAERRRVKELIERDQAARRREELRQIAQAQVESGEMRNVLDTIMEPTPEWRNHGDNMPYTPRQPEGTVRVVRTVRRVQSPQVRRIWLKGKIDEDQYRACIWYRAIHEAAGLVARCKTSKFDNMPGSGVALFGHLPATEREAAARKAYREVWIVLGDSGRFFEAVVIDDLPVVEKASAVSKQARAKAYRRFSAACDKVLCYIEAIEVDVANISVRRDG